MASLSTYELEVQNWEKDIFNKADDKIRSLIIEEYKRAVDKFRLVCSNNSIYGGKETCDCTAITLYVLQGLKSEKNFNFLQFAAVGVAPNKNNGAYSHVAVGVFCRSLSATPLIVFDAIVQSGLGQNNLQGDFKTWWRQEAQEWKGLCLPHYTGFGFGISSVKPCGYISSGDYISGWRNNDQRATEW